MQDRPGRNPLCSPSVSAFELLWSLLFCFNCGMKEVLIFAFTICGHKVRKYDRHEKCIKIVFSDNCSLIMRNAQVTKIDEGKLCYSVIFLILL
jgi:hypothetical protein